MKKRDSGLFVEEPKTALEEELFDYIVELHEYLWRFVTVAIKDADCDLHDHVDRAIEILEGGANITKG